MEITHSTIPGTGTVHHGRTRHGEQVGVVAEESGRRTLLVYDADDPDTPAHRVVLESDEADLLAELLQSRSVADRLTEIERRLAELGLG
ncbi:hypothetical protein DPM19_29700 [Actinomadura craniellae]|uniref:Potassium/proton antiporter subunit KhtT-like N-terminal domain-containing protein n=1 Tax=Actinomadura craniellae TaxID=2231787 RepID=A0A365GXC4_9ACTN|nr:hypothetical protein [Actinomadura craniellae]RAY11484.1 hypothetical protein DPM19_29700 [Actinomadura craniellae]